MSSSKATWTEKHKSLTDATTRYFAQLDSHALAEDETLAKDMMLAASTIDFDQEI